MQANVDPAIENDFNLYSAECEGNDKAGAALASEYEISDCGCVCSGTNAACGRVGSITYFSYVNSSEVRSSC